MQLETPNEKQKKKTPIATSHQTDAPANKQAGTIIPGFHRALATLCAMILGTVLFSNIASAQQVQGGTMFTLDSDEDGVESNWVHTFTAKQDADGTVAGRAYFSQRDENTIVFRSELRIDCMLFLDENTVILGGVTVRDTDPEFVGSTFVFVARDNGEGQVADQVSGVFYGVSLGFEIDCELAAFLLETEFDVNELLDPIHKGEVQVHP